jgi:hypothetical protein
MWSTAADPGHFPGGSISTARMSVAIPIQKRK